jgi:uncharacterized protein (TIGR02145 family)
MTKNIFAILLASSLFLFGCGDDSSSDPQDDSSKDSELSSSSGNSDKDDKNSSESKADSSSTSDSLNTEPAALFEKAQLTAIYGHSKWHEATVLEIDTAMNLTGREFMVKADCDSCPFVFENLKLQTPYALLRIDNKRYSISAPAWSFVDLGRTDSLHLNALTTLESKRIVKLMKDGLESDSAEKQAQGEILKEVFGDIPKLKHSNQIDEHTTDSVAAVVLQTLWSGSLPYNKKADTIFEKDGKWNDSIKIYFADRLADSYMYEYTSDIPTPRAERPVTTGIYGRIYGFGECSSKNIDSVKTVNDSTSKHYKILFVCSEKLGWYNPGTTFQDTYNWEPGYNGELRKGSYYENYTYAYDSVQGKWIYPSIQNGIPCITTNLGMVIKSEDPYAGGVLIPIPYHKCMDTGTQLFWNSANETEYYSQGIECDSAYTRRPSLVDSAVKVLCYDGKFTVIKPTEPEPPQEETLLEKEAKLINCGEDDESFHKGQIDTTIYYYCYKGDVAIAKEFDMAIGHGCHREHEGDYVYQNSVFTCNGFAWKFASDKLVTDTVTDERDGTIYQTVGIGSQIWISENLNYAIDSSWCPMHKYASTDTSWNADSSLKYCKKYGRFYRWDAILGENAAVENICPDGFHVPSNKELETLANFGKTWFKNETAADIFVSENRLEYSDGIETGDNLLGFSLYMIGSRNINGNYNGWLYSVNVCSRDTASEDRAYVYRISRDNSMEFAQALQKQNLSCNVRCLKD